MQSKIKFNNHHLASETPLSLRDISPKRGEKSLQNNERGRDLIPPKREKGGSSI